MKRRYREPSQVKDLLPGILRGLRPRRAALLQKIREAWPEIAGDLAASRSRIQSLEGGVLRVDLESAALKQHLTTFRYQEVLDRVQERFPKAGIRSIRYGVGRPS